jgi:cyclase
MKKFLLWGLGILLVLLIGLGAVAGPFLVRFMHITVVDLDPQMRVFLGGGGNSIVLRSEDAQQVLVVDTKIGPAAKRLKAYVDSLGPDAQVTIVNTHYHSDHTGGNSLYPKAVIIAGDYPDAMWRQGTGSRVPDQKVPLGQEKVLTIGSETVRIYNVGQAHTSNDLVVYFEKRKLLHTGDLVFNGWNPVLRRASGANVGKWMLALDAVQKRYDIAVVVPGHGPIADKDALLAMREYFAMAYAALGNPSQRAELRKRYAKYFSLPGMSGVDQTLKFIEAEQKAKR